MNLEPWIYLNMIEDYIYIVLEINVHFELYCSLIQYEGIFKIFNSVRFRKLKN